MDKINNSQKRKAKEAKYMKMFEKVFPELKKARQDKERFNRVNVRIKSEADLQYLNSLQKQKVNL